MENQIRPFNHHHHHHHATMYPQRQYPSGGARARANSVFEAATTSSMSLSSHNVGIAIDRNGGGLAQKKSPPPVELQRRESLVKPTWASINPGQMPTSTLDELVSNTINNNNNNTNHANDNGPGNSVLAGNNGGGIGHELDPTNNGEHGSELGMLTSKLLAKNGSGQTQKKREVELYDIFGKVRSTHSWFGGGKYESMNCEEEITR